MNNHGGELNCVVNEWASGNFTAAGLFRLMLFPFANKTSNTSVP
jgi:hypothetical protein